MNTLVEALNREETSTTNGMATHVSSLDSCVDLFFQAGALRGRDVIPVFSKAFAEDSEVATKLSLWLRDVRGGAGERQLFRDIFKYLVEKDVALAYKVLKKIPELGRWDCVLAAFDTRLERDALSMINHALRDGDALCAKWMPRKGDAAKKIRAYMQSSPKVYRKLLVSLSDTVEQKMCAREFDKINYSHVPSVAAARYQAAFDKRDPVGYATYRADLEKGVDKDGKTVKICADAVYPYDVVKSLKNGKKDVADAQWNALPDYLGGSDANILPVVDVSGSMTCGAGDNDRSILSCLDVAVSLGLYLSERSRGDFKDVFMTFSRNPELQRVKGSLSDRYMQMRQAHLQMNTNLERMFSVLLNAAVKNEVPQEDMPSMILILSDMQFDRCVNVDLNAFEMIRSNYASAGYKMPCIVFWNLHASNGGSPVTAHESGAALVSGFSPSIMESVLGADMEQFTPRGVMMKAIDKEKYSLG